MTGFALYLERRDPYAALMHGTVVAASAGAPCSTVEIDRDLRMASHARLLALPALARTSDPVQRIVGDLSDPTRAAWAIDTLNGWSGPMAPQPVDPGKLGMLGEVSDPVIAVDASGYIRFANPASSDLFARQLDALIGRPFGLPASGGSGPVTILRPKGGRGYADMRSVPCTIGGEQFRFVLLHDRTEAEALRTRLVAAGLADRDTPCVTPAAFDAAGDERLGDLHIDSASVLAVDILRSASRDEIAHTRILFDVAGMLDRLVDGRGLVSREGPSRFAVLVDHRGQDAVQLARALHERHPGAVTTGIAKPQNGERSIRVVCERAFASASASPRVSTF